jgi:hypothetical protein
MSRISVLGDNLLGFLHSYFPEYIESFLPGVSLEIIRSRFTNLTQVLPNDFYELYEWQNGNPEYFPQPFPSGDICQFNPLDTVVEEMIWEWFEDVPPLYNGYTTLPFITIDSEFIVIVLGRSYAEEAYIAYVDEVGDSYLYCDSIATMLESTVECLLTRAVFVDNSGCFEENQQLSSKIWRDKNPLTLRELISDLNLALESLVLNINQIAEGGGDSSYSATIEFLVSTLRALRRFRPPDAISLVQYSLSRIKEFSLEEMQGLEFALEQWLEDCDCINSLE